MRRRLTLCRTMPLEREALFSALSDYGRIHEWVEPLSGSRILAREHDIAIAQLDLAGCDDPVLLEVIETRPEQLTFAQVDRFKGEGIAGSVSLQPKGDDGATELSIDLKLPGPLFALRRVATIRDILDMALARLQRRLGGDEVATGDTADEVRILEVVREGGRLKVRLLGEVFDLTPSETP